MSQLAREWFAKSDADFRSMNWEMQATIVNCDAVVFHAHQCVEKLMKGILTSAGIDFERTHDLNVLAELLTSRGRGFGYDPADLATIQPGAVLLRYPGYNATAEDARRAIAACERLHAALLPLAS